jgi:hypothetical protein
MPALPNSLKSGLAKVQVGASGPPAHAQPIAPNAAAPTAARLAFKRTPAISHHPPEVLARIDQAPPSVDTALSANYRQKAPDFASGISALA